uniref:Odorant-binding protein 1 n=1 Tax=Aulacocentrum confusum TaxID=2767324 RepID=A0A7G8Z902_9HYME|nr:odorant-binding protein 1 [Aulacocentrum confusum]
MNSINVFCLFVLLFRQIDALQCRSGNEQTSDELRKIMEKCNHRQTDGKHDDNSSVDYSSDNSSEEMMFSKDFFTNNKKKTENVTKNSGSTSGIDSSDHYKRQFSNRPYDINYSNYSGLQQTTNTKNSNDDTAKISCNIHCFFDELNLVDQRGFPERISVTKSMIKNIHYSELRDFIEESILECFQFLSNDPNQDKCEYSQNLVNCFADKGKEGCEDWDE